MLFFKKSNKKILKLPKTCKNWLEPQSIDYSKSKTVPKIEQSNNTQLDSAIKVDSKEEKKETIEDFLSQTEKEIVQVEEEIFEEAMEEIMEETLERPLIEETLTDETLIEEISKEEPSKEEPSKEEPSKEEPSKEETLTEEPPKDEILTEKPSTEEPSEKEEPLVEETFTEEAFTEETFTEETLVEETLVEEPPEKEPPAKEPPAKEPSAKELSLKESSLEMAKKNPKQVAPLEHIEKTKQDTPLLIRPRNSALIVSPKKRYSMSFIPRRACFSSPPETKRSSIPISVRRLSLKPCEISFESYSSGSSTSSQSSQHSHYESKIPKLLNTAVSIRRRSSLGSKLPKRKSYVV